MYNSIEQLGQGRGGGSSPTQALVYLRTTYIGRWWWHAGRGVFRSCHREIMKKRQKNARWQLHTLLVEHSRHWWAWCVVLQQVV